MDSMFSSASTSSPTSASSVFGSLDEILDEGESGCPAFDRLIQRAENENSELVRILEEETRKHTALQKELEDANSQREKLECSSKSLKEEEKQLQRLAKQNKEISESLKRTNTLLYQHEGTLQKKYEKACLDLQQLQLDNVEVVDKYRGTWDRYYAYYEKSKLAVDLANTKKTALEKEKQARDTEERIKEVQIKLMDTENEMKNIAERLKNGPKSSKTAIIKLAQLHIQASKAIKLGNEKLDQLQKCQRKGDQENMIVPTIIVEYEGQQVECETENTDQELQRKELSPGMMNENGPIPDNQKHQLQHTVVIINNDAEQPSPSHQPCSFQGENPDIPSRGIAQPTQKDLSPKQDSLLKHNNPQMLLQPKAPTFELSSQKTTLSRPVDSFKLTDSPRPSTTNAKGLSNYGRFLSPYSHINKPYTFQTSLSPARAPQYKLFNSSSKAPCTSQQSQNWLQDSYSKTVNNEVKISMENSAAPRDITQVRIPSQECQEQMMTDDITPTLNTSAKSPGPRSNPVSPKTPTKQSESSDLFNFTEFNERLRLMNKSPGEGFSYPSRRMFDTVENMNEDTDNNLPKQSFFQPFFATRENEPQEQFAGKSTFFSMDPQSSQESIAPQGHQFQIEREQSSNSNSNNLFSPLTSGEECGTSSGVGFSLFSDQPAANLGCHGNQSPQSPAFSFNFCSSPSLPTEKSPNNTGTFNLF